MKLFFSQVIQSVALSALIPGLLFSVMADFGHKVKPEAPTEPTTIPETRPPQSEEESIKIPVLKNGKVINMELEEYICRVVLAEMPASFETEALKAQAVAVRTYTLRTIMGGNKHKDAHICTDSSCCQAFVNYKADSVNGKGLEKVRNAVMETAGEGGAWGIAILALYMANKGKGKALGNS